MKLNFNLRITLLSFAFLFLLGTIYSCSTEDTKSDDITYQKKAVQDLAFAQTLFRDLFRTTYKIATTNYLADSLPCDLDSGILSKITNGYALTYPVKGIRCPDGKLRTGSLYILPEISEGDSVIILQLRPEKDYTVQGHKVSGDITLFVSVNNGKPDVLNYKVQSAVIELNRTYSPEIRYNANLSFIRATGEETPLIFNDDSFLVYGDESGNSQQHDPFLVTMTDTATLYPNNRYLQDGAASIILTGFSVDRVTFSYPKKEETAGTIKASVTKLNDDGSPLIYQSFPVTADYY